MDSAECYGRRRTPGDGEIRPADSGKKNCHRGNGAAVTGGRGKTAETRRRGFDDLRTGVVGETREIRRGIGAVPGKDRPGIAAEKRAFWNSPSDKLLARGCVGARNSSVGDACLRREAGNRALRLPRLRISSRAECGVAKSARVQDQRRLRASGRRTGNFLERDLLRRRANRNWGSGSVARGRADCRTRREWPGVGSK